MEQVVMETLEKAYKYQSIINLIIWTPIVIAVYMEYGLLMAVVVIISMVYWAKLNDVCEFVHRSSTDYTRLFELQSEINTEIPEIRTNLFSALESQRKINQSLLDNSIIISSTLDKVIDRINKEEEKNDHVSMSEQF